MEITQMISVAVYLCLLIDLFVGLLILAFIYACAFLRQAYITIRENNRG